MRKKFVIVQGVLLLFLILFLKLIYRPFGITGSRNVGLLLPHNPVFLSETINYLDRLTVDTVVVLAPNHRDKNKLILSLNDNKEYVDGEYAWTIYRDLFSTLNPAIVVEPRLFRRGSTLKELFELADNLKRKYAPAKVLFIASVDFAHYTDETTAGQNDRLTLSLIKNENWESLIKLDSTYLDCPECIIVFCQTTNNCSKIRVDKRIYLDGTSYLFGTIERQ